MLLPYSTDCSVSVQYMPFRSAIRYDRMCQIPPYDTTVQTYTIAHDPSQSNAYRFTMLWSSPCSGLFLLTNPRHILNLFDPNQHRYRSTNTIYKIHAAYKPVQPSCSPPIVAIFVSWACVRALVLLLVFVQWTWNTLRLQHVTCKWYLSFSKIQNAIIWSPPHSGGMWLAK